MMCIPRTQIEPEECSRPRLPAFGITRGREDGDDEDPARFRPEVDPEGEPADQTQAGLAFDPRKAVGRRRRIGKNRPDSRCETHAETLSGGLVPGRRVGEVAAGRRLDDNLEGHLGEIRARISDST